MEGRRDHVLSQRRVEPFLQRVGIQWLLAGIEGHQVLAAVGSPSDDDRALVDARHAQQCVFDLADLYPEAADLDLIISPTEELQLAVGQPTAVITAAVQSAARAVRVRHERLLRALWVVDVTAANAYAGEDDLSWRAERHQSEVLVNDVDRHIVDWPTEWDPLPVGHAVHDFVVGVV